MLLDKNGYIARSEYLSKVDQYTSVIDFFNVLSSSGMLSDFCKKNSLSAEQARGIIDLYNELEKRVYFNFKVSEHSLAIYSGDSFMPFFIHVSDTSHKPAAIPLAMYSCWEAKHLSEARHKAL